jgi:hypothetical protein
VSDPPKIWVRVIESHAARTYVAVILAVSAGLSLVILVASAMWNVVANPEVQDLSPNYASAISATLGVLVGALATYVGTGAVSQPGKPGEPLRDDDIVLGVDNPTDPPAPPPP